MFLKTVQQVKRFFLILLGLTVVLAGVVMLVTPGPGWAAIFAGLAILSAAEVMWARRLMHQIKDKGKQIVDTVRGKPAASQSSAPNASVPPATENANRVT
jgi:uncharacterized protein (TIGR02611 family)